MRDRFSQIDGFRDTLRHLAGGIYFGRSAGETEWFRDSRGLGIKRIVPIHPKRLSYASFDDWELRLYDEFGNNAVPELGYFPGVKLSDYPDKFVMHAPLTIGGELPTRQGVGRLLVYTSLFWGWSVRHWMQFAELFAIPWRVGYYEKGLDGDDIEALKEALLGLSGLSTAVFPKGCEPDIISPPTGAGTTHKDLREAFNHEISKVVLGQTLTTEVGDKGT